MYRHNKSKNKTNKNKTKTKIHHHQQKVILSFFFTRPALSFRVLWWRSSCHLTSPAVRVPLLTFQISPFFLSAETSDCFTRQPEKCWPLDAFNTSPQLFGIRWHWTPASSRLCYLLKLRLKHISSAPVSIISTYVAVCPTASEER